MRTQIEVLTDQELERIHHSSLQVLAEVGVRVESAKARSVLKEAGAQVEDSTRLVRFPAGLVEQSLKTAPKQFTLGARRPGWDLPLNQKADCKLVADGEAASVMAYPERKRRPATVKDWFTVTKLLDTIDEVGVYWAMVQGTLAEGGIADQVRYWKRLFSNFSKHIQDPISEASHAPWFMEVLQVIFGDRQTIRQRHPVSFLVCPQSPLLLDEQYTEACMALAGWDIPVAIMPMPLMGSTSPGTMISMLITGNCEVLAMICLLQAIEPGWPVIYAPSFAASNPRTGLYSAGAIENGILSVAGIQLGRYYNLPVEGTGGGTDHFFPGIQAGYERAMTAMLPALADPDLLVGPGLLGGSTVLSMEQLLIDVEVFRMSRHSARGIDTTEERWLMDDIRKIGAGGHFLGARSTARAIRDGEWFHPKLGLHDTLDSWNDRGQVLLLDQAHALVEEKLKSHQPLPLPDEVVRELDVIFEKAQLADERQR